VPMGHGMTRSSLKRSTTAIDGLADVKDSAVEGQPHLAGAVDTRRPG
jgi:hypothetical protein